LRGFLEQFELEHGYQSIDKGDIHIEIFKNSITRQEYDIRFYKLDRFDLECFAYKIEVENKFKYQPWASKFQNGRASPIALNTLLEILKYCDRVDELKAFW